MASAKRKPRPPDKLYLFRCDNCRYTKRQKRNTICHKCGRGVMQAIGEG